MLTLLQNAFICTGLPQGFIENGAVLLRDSRIEWIGPHHELPEILEPVSRKDLCGRVVIPGWCRT